MRKYLLIGLLLAMSAGCAGTPEVRAGQLIDMEIVSRGGAALPTYSHRGRIWVSGNPGERYAVRLTNRSSARVLAVLSVDGVNAVSGETASAQQAGYVLEPWASAEIRGWRKSLDDVAQFYFTSLSDSYAGRTGRPGNVGVIGVAVFREYQEPSLPLEMKRRSEVPAPATPKAEARGATSDAAREGEGGADAARSAKRSQPSSGERIGTGHGAREHSPTRYTDFRRASPSPAEVVQTYYDSHANLVARGIIPRSPYQGRPEPFPRDVPGPFVPDPRG